MPRKNSSYGGAITEKSLVWVADLLRPRAAAFDREYRKRLASLGFTPGQRRFLSEITPGAAVHALSLGQSPRDFFSRAVQAARVLALDDTPLNLIVRALSEYQRLTESAWSELPVAQRKDAAWIRMHLQSALLLIVNEAYAAVQRDESELVSSVLDAEVTTNDPQKFLEANLRSLVTYFQAADGVLFTEETGGLKLALQTGSVEKSRSVHTILARTLRQRIRTLKASDALEGPMILLPSWRENSHTVWSAPSGTAVLQLRFTENRPLYAREERLLRVAADRCAATVVRMEREERLRDVGVRMLEVEEIERRRLSRELHDDAGQSLVVARLQLEMLEMSLPEEAAEARATVNEIRTITEKTILGVRKLISDLSPAVLEQLGLGAAVRQLTNRFRAAYPCRVKLTVAPLPRLNPRFELVIYRVLQECFTNISRHSGARNVNISLTSTDRTLRLAVADDGVGFQVEEGLGRRNCFGLLGIRERVHLLGGRFQVDSTPEGGQQDSTKSPSGTKVFVELPLTGEYPNSQ